jgi:hypothetical protein
VGKKQNQLESTTFLRTTAIKPNPGTCDSQNSLALSFPIMDILKMLSDLRQEREQIGEAIIALERLAQGHGKRLGRPPAWMSPQKNMPKRRGRPPGSRNKD